MKNIIFLCVFFATTSGFLMSQNDITPDSRLNAVYNQNYLDNLLLDNSNQLKYLNWYLDNSYKIVEVGLEKSEQMPYLVNYDPLTKTTGTSVNHIDEETFNIFLYNCENKYDQKTYYRIGNTGYAVEVESLRKLAEKYNKYNNENQ